MQQLQTIGYDSAVKEKLQALTILVTPSEKAAIEKKLNGMPFSAFARQVIAAKLEIELPVMRPGRRKDAERHTTP